MYCSGYYPSRANIILVVLFSVLKRYLYSFLLFVLLKVTCILFLYTNSADGAESITNPIYCQHAHFIPIVGVGKERRTLIGPW